MSAIAVVIVVTAADDDDGVDDTTGAAFDAYSIVILGNSEVVAAFALAMRMIKTCSYSSS